MCVVCVFVCCSTIHAEKIDYLLIGSRSLPFSKHRRYFDHLVASLHISLINHLISSSAFNCSRIHSTVQFVAHRFSMESPCSITGIEAYENTINGLGHTTWCKTFDSHSLVRFCCWVTETANIVVHEFIRTSESLCWCYCCCCFSVFVVFYEMSGFFFDLLRCMWQ